MDNSNKVLPPGYEHSIATPETAEQRKRWQEINQQWWQNQPMRYDFSQPLDAPEFSKKFYEEIDRRFFEDVREFMPWDKVPFDNLINFEALKTQDVLEIGVGNGSHAALLAARAKTFTGIDLTEYAIKSTSARFKWSSLEGKLIQMDAEEMKFPDGSFDFVWSWGVIHHSSDTGRILSEIQRVLRPGGRAITMVYHRSFWNYYVMAGLVHGLIRGRIFKDKTLHAVHQRHMDGAIARCYSKQEWKTVASQHLVVEDVRIFGSKLELVPLPRGGLKNFVRRILPNPVSRFFTNSCGWGTFLVSELRKPA